MVLIAALLEQGAKGLTVVSHNCGVDGAGLGVLLAQGRIDRLIASCIGQDKDHARQLLSGGLEVELTPQGTLAERLRAGGAGIAAFFTPAGVGTLLAEGGLPWRYDDAGNVVVASPPKQVREFELGGRRRAFVLEEGDITDVALVRAAVADRHRNAVFHAVGQLQPAAAMAGRMTVLEAERLVEPGDITRTTCTCLACSCSGSSP